MRKFIIFFCVFLMFGFVNGQNQRSPINIANRYCKILGYEILRDELAKKTYCLLPDGQTVEPWSFFRGEVAPEFSYCVKNGKKIRTKKVKQGKNEYVYPICYSKGKSQHMLKFMEENGDYNKLYPNTIGSPPIPPDTIPSPGPYDFPEPDRIGGYVDLFNWNSNGGDYVGPPGDQGDSLGICYAIASTSVAESAYAIEFQDSDSLKDLSEAFTTFFYANNNSGISYHYEYMMGSYGAAQGYWYEPLKKLIRQGTVEESEFPMPPIIWNEIEHEDTVWNDDNYGCERYRFTSWGEVGESTQDIMDALLQHGPLTAIMASTPGFLVENSTKEFVDPYFESCFDLTVLGLFRHMVVIVGWQYVPYEGYYWIVKNSYGDWGHITQPGYMKILSTSHGINCYVGYLEYEPYLFSESNFAHDQITISNVPYMVTNTYTRVQYRPEPYDWFNDFSMDEWKTTNNFNANLIPKSNKQGPANIIFKINYEMDMKQIQPGLGPDLDHDTLEYAIKPVWVGKPLTPIITGSSIIGCDEPTNYLISVTDSSQFPWPTADSFQWSVSSGIQIVGTYAALPYYPYHARIRIKAMSSGNHTITVIASNGGPVTSSNTINITSYCSSPENPEIIGPSAINCPDLERYDIEGATGNFSWSVSGPINIVEEHDSYCIIVGTATGEGIIEAIDGDLHATKNVSVTCESDPFSIIGPTYIQPYSTERYDIEDGAGSFNWEVTWPLQIVASHNDFCYIKGIASGNGQISASQGGTTASLTVYVYASGPEPLSAFPNPTASNLTVEMNYEEEVNCDFMFDIINKDGEIKKFKEIKQNKQTKFEQVVFDVSGLPIGLYILRVNQKSKEGKINSHLKQIVISR
ncbi:C1 family peptidase [Bacteroidota bacterium]